MSAYAQSKSGRKIEAYIGEMGLKLFQSRFEMIRNVGQMIERHFECPEIGERGNDRRPGVGEA
jgi:hypothetical protein